MPSDSQRESLPFEPKSNKQPSSKKASTNSSSSPKTSTPSSQGSSKVLASSKDEAGIPKIVSRRMMRRMAVFAGIPTFLGMSSFVISYILLTQHIVEFPNIVVLIISLSLFGLGTLGLSYGVLSASWQEDVEGSLLGTTEFSVNFQRLVQGLRKRPTEPKP
ncbi:MAG: DUF3464 family protein [Leptolyngbya sp. SIO3F4]|nr:DUF3464 family protein [Leptolyngbya sp. SIO3F4]